MLDACAAIIAGSRDHRGRSAREQPAQDPPANSRRTPVDAARSTLRAEQPGRLAAAGLLPGAAGALTRGRTCCWKAATPILRDGRLCWTSWGPAPMEAAAAPAQAEAAGVAEAVTFHGWLPHAQVQQALAGPTLLTLPRSANSAAAVVLEAMALGGGAGDLRLCRPGRAGGRGYRLQGGDGRPRRGCRRLPRDAGPHASQIRRQLAPMAEAGRRVWPTTYTWRAKASASWRSTAGRCGPRGRSRPRTALTPGAQDTTETEARKETDMEKFEKVLRESAGGAAADQHRYDMNRAPSSFPSRRSRVRAWAMNLSFENGL